MLTELNISYPTARKEHRCMWCCGTIKVGEKYERQTLKYDNQIYDWVSHLECKELTSVLNMYDWDNGNGITEDIFQEYIQEYLYNHHYNKETDTYDDDYDLDQKSYHDIVLKILQEKNSVTPSEKVAHEVDDFTMSDFNA